MSVCINSIENEKGSFNLANLYFYRPRTFSIGCIRRSGNSGIAIPVNDRSKPLQLYRVLRHSNINQTSWLVFLSLTEYVNCISSPFDWKKIIDGIRSSETTSQMVTDSFCHHFSIHSRIIYVWLEIMTVINHGVCMVVFLISRNCCQHT